MDGEERSMSNIGVVGWLAVGAAASLGLVQLLWIARSLWDHRRSLRGLPKALSNADIRRLPAQTVAASSEQIPDEECVVCLGRYEDGDGRLTLPGCQHAFHVDCAGQWLAIRATCPVCRVPVQPLPAAAPVKLPSVPCLPLRLLHP